MLPAIHYATRFALVRFRPSLYTGGTRDKTPFVGVMLGSSSIYYTGRKGIQKMCLSLRRIYYMLCHIHLWPTKGSVNMYTNEAALAGVFDEMLTTPMSPFSAECATSEFNYTEGKTDRIALDTAGNVFAFEMKLIKWRQALHQAYRNSSFAHYSYVVLPSAIARTAIKNEAEFQKRRVGLCSIDESGIKIEIEAPRSEPLRPWLTSCAIDSLMRGAQCQRIAVS